MSFCHPQAAALAYALISENPQRPLLSKGRTRFDDRFVSDLADCLKTHTRPRKHTTPHQPNMGAEEQATLATSFVSLPLCRTSRQWRCVYSARQQEEPAERLRKRCVTFIAALADGDPMSS